MNDRSLRDLAKITYDDFAGFQGATFNLHLQQGTLPLLLSEVDAPPAAPDGEPPRERPFAMLFKGPLATRLPQRIYRLDNPGFGVIELFLVPVGQEPDGYLYESIFN